MTKTLLEFIGMLKNKLKGKFVNDMLFTIVSLLVVGASGLILQTLINNNFGVEKLGIYAQIIALYSLISCISVFGIEISTLKHTAEFVEKKSVLKEIYSSSQLMVLLWSTFVGALLCTTVYYFSFLFSSNDVASGMIYVLPGSVFFALNKNSNAFVSGLRKIKLYSLIRVFRWVCIMGLTGSMYFYDWSFQTNLMFYSIVEFFIFLFFLIYNRSFLKIITDRKWFRIHFNYGSTNIIAVIIGSVKASFMVLISGYYLTLEEVGLLAVLLNFTNIFSLITSAIQVNHNPIFANEWNKGNVDKVVLNFKKIFKVTSYGGLPLYLISIVAYVLYLYLFIDIDYNTTVFFAIMAIGTLITFVFSWAIPVLSLSGFIIANLWRNVYNFSAQMIITFVALYFYGFNGAIIAYVLVEISSLLISYKIIEKNLKLNLFQVFYAR